MAIQPSPAHLPTSAPTFQYLHFVLSVEVHMKWEYLYYIIGIPYQKLLGEMTPTDSKFSLHVRLPYKLTIEQAINRRSNKYAVICAEARLLGHIVEVEFLAKYDEAGFGHWIDGPVLPSGEHP
jgi:hypothetical protein